MKRSLFLALAAILLAVAPVAAADKNPVVVMETSMGTIKIELFQDKAPITVRNFLGYVDDKFYDGLIFHRVIPGFMIQGGGMQPGLKEKKTKDAIKNESSNGLTNQRSTIAMARTPAPDSATAQFFINLVNNDALNRTAGEIGYCVFGKVLEGMDVVDKIAMVKTRVVIPGRLEDVPVQDVVIKSVRRAEK